MARSTVAVLKTNPATVIGDYGRLMRMAHYPDFVSKDVTVQVVGALARSEGTGAAVR